MIQFIKRLLGVKPKKQSHPLVDAFHAADQMKQDHEDQMIERDAKREAQEMFEQWLRGDMILLPRPRRCVIMCYTESKFDAESYKQLKQDEFNRLKNEWMENNPGKNPRAFNITLNKSWS